MQTVSNETPKPRVVEGLDKVWTTELWNCVINMHRQTQIRYSDVFQTRVN
jgi:hypothetical protein